jgi:ABC-type nitrate/sulfonate/bicarbonate transport system substrate-binding protein
MLEDAAFVEKRKTAARGFLAAVAKAAPWTDNTEIRALGGTVQVRE